MTVNFFFNVIKTGTERHLLVGITTKKEAREYAERLGMYYRVQQNHRDSYIVNLFIYASDSGMKYSNASTTISR